MIKPEQVPNEVVWKLHDKLWKHGGPSVDEAREAIAAALNAWPALEICYFLPQGRTITLPFPNVSKYPRKEGDK